MKYLIDANIFLESLLEQEKAQETNALLLKANELDFYITDFAYHSIGITLFNKKKFEKFRRFVLDMFVDAGMLILVLHQEDTEQLISVAQRFNLDFDDAYQYTVAEKYDLHIVSFDTDFDGTERGRMTPQQVLKAITQQTS
ncbi:MAG: type II toxin-antitoxin system VapC family toxin [Ignavibacteriales bacterium]|nr:type II toxin-antitoxin system VapC family toxin [Ignavibacteriales bacterium]